MAKKINNNLNLSTEQMADIMALYESCEFGEDTPTDADLVFETDCVAVEPPKKQVSQATLEKIRADREKAQAKSTEWTSRVEKALAHKTYGEAVRKGKTAQDFFEILTDEEKYDAILRMAYALPKIVAKFACDDDGVIAQAGWMRTADDFRTVAHESYCDLVDIAEKSPNLPLGKAIFRASWNSCRRQYRQLVRSASALQKQVDENGEEYENEVFDLFGFAEPSHENSPERAVVFETSLEECCLDERDYFVVSMKMDGYTSEEISDFLGVSRQAVDKRFKAFVERFTDPCHLSGDRELSQYYCEKVLDEIRQAFKPVAEFADRWHEVTSVLTD